MDLPEDEPEGRRVVQAWPTNLLEDCTTYLEEQLYSQAFSTMSATLLSSASNSSPVLLPPPQYISLAATLSVHPHFTTRTLSRDKRIASKDALSYLKHVVRSVDTEDSRLAEAFSFEGASVSSIDRLKRAKTRGSENPRTALEDEHGRRRINVSYAHEQSIFRNAKDFWSVLGWAFNCSICNKARWEIWRPWIEVVLDAIESDLKAYKGSTDIATQVKPSFSDNLVSHLVSSIGESRSNKRRVMRALFADGTFQSLTEFPEVWDNEISPPKQRQREHSPKRKRLDIENGEFADYLDDSDELASEHDSTRLGTARKSFVIYHSDGSQANTEADNSDSETKALANVEREKFVLPLPDYGGSDSISLRQRFIAAFCQLSHQMAGIYTDVEEFFDVLSNEFLRPLPLNIFQQFVLPNRQYLDFDLQMTLNETLFRPLIVVGAPKNSTWMVSEQILATSYAPFAAANSTATDNAKISLLIESLLRGLWTTKQLSTELVDLSEAVEQGIRVRTGKVGHEGRRKARQDSAAEAYAQEVLLSSSARMQSILATLHI